VSRHSNKQIGLLAAFFYAFIPYNIYYGRTILPDTSMVMATLGGIYFFDLWVEKNSKLKIQNSKESVKNKNYLFFILAIVFTSSAFLLKPYALFFTLPMVVLVYHRWGWGLLKKWQLWVFALLSVLPLILWRQWMTQYPEGIPANAWLLNGNGIRFRPAFFRWIGYERLTKLISGYFGVIILAFGFLAVKKLKEWLFLSAFVVSSILYVVVFATGNVQHDYYQILIMPSLAIFFAIGSYFLYMWSVKKIPLGKIILVLCWVGSFYFSWHQVRDYFNINNPSLMVAGEAVDRLTPKDAKVIANYTGDTSFLYQTKRKGWPSFEKDMPEMIRMGASYLVLVNPTEQDMGFAKTYKVVAKTKEYVLFDLRKP
jgi:4-amino-4-deoxy-L-arabinose transferase-like glycosyltransferase